ncbi:MAG TPA: M56 family metallopeptidase [Acidobacteriota bacterium]|nr:M56 family metallopeptidase [Acidobacteriota bacterium]
MQDILQFWTHLDSWTQLLVLAGLKATMLLSLGFGAAFLLRRNSASLRHLTWSLVLAALLLLPVLSLAAPSWSLKVLPPKPDADIPFLSRQAHHSGTLGRLEGESATGPQDSQAASPSAVDDAPSRVGPLLPMVPGQIPPPLALDASRILLGLWLAGVLLAGGRLLLAAVLLRRELARAETPRGPEWTDLLDQVRHRVDLQRPLKVRLGRAQQMPLVWGLLRPVVLLPAQARHWSRQERRAVLLHEAAHIKRYDLLVQLLASLACALYWFNPLVWMAAKAVRREREQACDDLVLRCGTRPSAYARQLLTLAQRMKGARLVSAASLAMSRPSELEGRLLAILNGRQNRGAASTKVMLALAASILLAAVPLAALTPAPQEEPIQEGQEQESSAGSGLSEGAGSASVVNSGPGGQTTAGGVSGTTGISGSGAAVSQSSSGRSGAGVSQSASTAVVPQTGASGSEASAARVVSSGTSQAQTRVHQETRPGDRSGNISLSERDGSRWRIEMEGLQVDEDYNLAGFKGNGYLRIEARREGRSQVLVVEPDGSGGLRRTYRVDGTSVDDPQAAEELLRQGMERIRRTDASHEEARHQIEQTRRQVEEAQLQVQEAARQVRAQQALGEQEVTAVARRMREQMRQVQHAYQLGEGDYRLALEDLEQRLRDLRATVPEMTHESLEATRQALEESLALRRQALDANHAELAREMAEVSEQLQGELSQVRDSQIFALERLQALQDQLESELSSGMASQMDDVRQAMDHLRQEMDHLRETLQAARSQFESTLRQALEPHDLGWEPSRLERRIESVIHDLFEVGELNEENGSYHFTAPRGQVLNLLNDAFAEPLQRLEGSARNDLRETLDDLADQLADLRW